MKQAIRRNLTNIIFLVLIVSAALAIYLLSRGSGGAAPLPAVTAETPTPAASVSPSPRGVPEAVFTTHLQTSSAFTASVSEKDSRTWTLEYGKDPAVTALLLYEVRNGCVASLEVTFYVPATYSENAKSAIEQYLYEASKTKSAAMPNAVRAVLGDLLPACDAESGLTGVTARYWAEQAVLLDKQGADFEDSQAGCHFIAYRAARSDIELLVCTLSFES